MPSSSDSEKHLAVACDFNVSVVTGDVSPKAWALGPRHRSILIDSASINKPPHWVGTNPPRPSAHPASGGRRSRAALGGHSRHL